MPVCVMFDHSTITMKGTHRTHTYGGIKVQAMFEKQPHTRAERHTRKPPTHARNSSHVYTQWNQHDGIDSRKGARSTSSSSSTPTVSILGSPFPRNIILGPELLEYSFFWPQTLNVPCSVYASMGSYGGSSVPDLWLS
jgi:hypothetical protein